PTIRGIWIKQKLAWQRRRHPSKTTRPQNEFKTLKSKWAKRASFRRRPPVMQLKLESHRLLRRQRGLGQSCVGKRRSSIRKPQRTNNSKWPIRRRVSSAAPWTCSVQISLGLKEHSL